MKKYSQLNFFLAKRCLDARDPLSVHSVNYLLLCLHESLHGEKHHWTTSIHPPSIFSAFPILSGCIHPQWLILQNSKLDCQYTTGYRYMHIPVCVHVFIVHEAPKGVLWKKIFLYLCFVKFLKIYSTLIKFNQSCWLYINII